MSSNLVIEFSLFTSNPKECAQQIYEASRNVGFFYLKNHGVSQDSINRMFKCSKRFFQRPLQSKDRYLMKDNVFGYTPVKFERFMAFSDIQWKENRQVLEGVGGRYFFDEGRKWGAQSGTNLRFLHYPPQDGDPKTSLAGSLGSASRLQPDLKEYGEGPSHLIREIMQCFAMRCKYLRAGALVILKPKYHYRSRYSTGYFLFANADIRLDSIPSPLNTQEKRAEAVEFEEG
ncbi:hypothetical protein BX616_003616 [Lobosporangium transversale]|nr:hypothetical protein BX616_003616 [Lobosporangium transversale]